MAEPLSIDELRELNRLRTEKARRLLGAATELVASAHDLLLVSDKAGLAGSTVAVLGKLDAISEELQPSAASEGEQ